MKVSTEIKNKTVIMYFITIYYGYFSLKNRFTKTPIKFKLVINKWNYSDLKLYEQIE